jgi:hypothetical protein
MEASVDLPSPYGERASTPHGRPLAPGTARGTVVEVNLAEVLR